MRNYDNLSDYEFEGLVGDLLGTELGIRFERFTRGPDQGIDLRHFRRRRRSADVVQVKHYKGSTWNDLKSAAKRELPRLKKLKPKPATYRFVTSQGLTPARKQTLKETLSPFIAREDYVLGRDDVDSLLDSHPDVERRHTKLWLGSSAALDALLKSGTYTRSRHLAEEIRRTLPLWVQGEAFTDARTRLANESVCLIAGPAGIGKTTLAQMLVAGAIDDGFEPIAVSGDIEEAWDVFDPEIPQIFFYDDFLGHTTLVELTKNEDSRLVSFMARVAESPNTLFVLTTREYILQRAVQMSERLRRQGLASSRLLLRLDRYSRFDRALILHNHVWQSPRLDASAMDELAADRGYKRIVDHSNFTPRLIEYITGLQPRHAMALEPGQRWIDTAVDALDHPKQIWRHAWEQQLRDVERALLLTLSLLPRDAQINDLRAAFDRWCEVAGIPLTPKRFERALEVVDEGFVRSRLEGGELLVSVLNPGLQDFLDDQFDDDPSLVSLAVSAAAFFEQLAYLWNRGRDDPKSSVLPALLATDLASAVDRLLTEPSAVWVLVRGSSNDSRMRHWHFGVESRLSNVIDMARAPGAPTALMTLVEARLEALLEDWHAGHGDEGGAFRLVPLLLDGDAPFGPDGWQEGMKSLLTNEPVQADEWEHVAEFRDLVPDVFSDDDWSDLQTRFGSWASYELRYRADEMQTEDELYEIEVAAEQFEVALDDSDIEVARKDIRERLAAQDHYEDMELQRWKEEDRPVERAEEGQLDSLFRGSGD
ncbi:MAG: hypothetical protein QOH76_3963 [Thermoleophilaceae bacterium]|nr:hypothetical protein [Thermoleophilaceae bacterium]